MPAPLQRARGLLVLPSLLGLLCLVWNGWLHRSSRSSRFALLFVTLACALIRFTALVTLLCCLPLPFVSRVGSAWPEFTGVTIVLVLLFLQRVSPAPLHGSHSCTSPRGLQ